jgi:hypothetical protein
MKSQALAAINDVVVKNHYGVLQLIQEHEKKSGVRLLTGTYADLTKIRSIYYDVHVPGLYVRAKNANFNPSEFNHTVAGVWTDITEKFDRLIESGVFKSVKPVAFVTLGDLIPSSDDDSYVARFVLDFEVEQ